MPSGPGSNLPLYASLFGTTLGMAALALGWRWRASFKLVRLWLALALFCMIMALTTCGGGGGGGNVRQGTPPGTTQVIVTTSTGTSSKTATVTLVVQ